MIYSIYCVYSWIILHCKSVKSECSGKLLLEYLTLLRRSRAPLIAFTFQSCGCFETPRNSTKIGMNLQRKDFAALLPHWQRLLSRIAFARKFKTTGRRDEPAVLCQSERSTSLDKSAKELSWHMKLHSRLERVCVCV